MRFRLTSPKAVSIVTTYLSLLGVLAMLALPPEVGRLDELRQEGLLRAMLIVQMILVSYFCSATASGEIAIEGEKSAWDLAASAFPSRIIASGKVATSAVFAVTLLLLGFPIIIIIAAIRGEMLLPIAWSPVVAVPFAVAMGALGALYAAVFESDFTRSFVHWLTLVVLGIGSAALPAPWAFISPVRALAAAAQEQRSDVWVAALIYLPIAGIAAWALQRRVDAIRREAEAA